MPRLNSNRNKTKVKGKVSVGYPLPSLPDSEEWKSFVFHFHDFPSFSFMGYSFITSPKFSCNGHQWELHIVPGGTFQATEGNVSVFLHHLSEETITTVFNIKIIDKFGKTGEHLKSAGKREFTCAGDEFGLPDFISRFEIFDESQNILDDNGTLTFVVSMEEKPTPVFIPKNPFVNVLGEMFNDEATADICFKVSVGSDDDDEKKGEAQKSKSSVSFYAHRLILEKCAPMLAAICGSNNDSGGIVIASVNDVKPHIFHHLLFYVYGGSIPEEELKTHAKGIIDAADKYSIINLKLAAEAAYVQSTDISLDNAMDNLLYADSRNCALLKEAVMNFLADNHYAAASNISFSDFPTHVVKDLLVAFGRNSKKGVHGTNVDELTTLCVSALRRKLDKMGLEVDGSREAMIDSIKSHS